MAPKGAKIWNEDLLQALRARQDVSQRAGKRDEVMYKSGADAVEAIRNDIYTFKNGRIVGLPSNKLKKTIDDLCRCIIDGSKPILPPGYMPTTAAERGGDGNPYLTSNYLRKLKIRGGAFAILMALSAANRATLSKDQLTRAAQPFCDDAMEANFHAGRPHGAWAGNVTLVKHGLLGVHKARVSYNERAGGLRAMGQNAYFLTREGEQFVQALLQIKPEVRAYLGGGGGGGLDPSTMGRAVAAGREFAAAATPRRTAANPDDKQRLTE